MGKGGRWRKMHPGKNKTNWNERRKGERGGATTSANAHALLFPHPIEKPELAIWGTTRNSPVFRGRGEKGRIWSSGGICRKEVWSQNTKRRSPRLIRPPHSSPCVCTCTLIFFLLFSGKSLIEGSWKKRKDLGIWSKREGKEN